MRARQAFLQEDGTLLMNGHVYKELPAFNRELMLEEDGNWISVTLPDVPVLLSASFLIYSMRSMGDGIVLCGSRDGWYVYYCRSDRYDEMVAAIKADAPMTMMFYKYYDPNLNEDLTYFLTDEEFKAVWSAYAEGEPINASKISTYYSIVLKFCTADKLFCQDGIYLEYTDDTYYLTDSDANYVQVPEEYEPIFAQIVAKDQELYYDDIVLTE